MSKNSFLQGKVSRLACYRMCFFAAIICLFSFDASAQWMLINQGGGQPDSSAALEIRDTTRGLLLPRLSQSQINSIVSPKQGLILFNTDSNHFEFYNGSFFSAVSGTRFSDQDADTYIEVEATSDDDIVRVFTAGSEAARFRNGNFGIGVANPTQSIHLGASEGIRLNDFLAKNDTAIVFHNSAGDLKSIVIPYDSTKVLRGDLSFGSAQGDHLGNHSATANLQLDGNWLSGDGDNEGLFITNDGKVGIGTSTPTLSADLHVADTTTRLIVESTKDPSWAGLELFTPNSRHQVISGFNMNGFAVRDLANNTALLVIDSLGNTGIGTNSPGAKLHINTSPPVNANSGQIQIEESTTNKVMFVGRTEDYGYVQTQGATPLSLNPISNPVGAGISNPKAAFQQGSVTGLLSAIGNAHFTGNLYHDGTNWRAINTGKGGFINIEPSVGSMGFYTIPATTSADAIASEFRRMLIDSTGKVGIGTATPDALLTVNGETKTTNFTMTTGAAVGRVLQSDAAGSASWVNPSTFNQNIASVLTTGNDAGGANMINVGRVRVGGPSVIGVVGILGDAPNTLNLAVANNNDSAGITFQNAGGNYAWKFYRKGGANPDLIFAGGQNQVGYINLPERMRLAANGNVGINNSAPSERLEVTGGVKADSLISDRMTSSSTGNANLMPVAYGRITGAGGITVGTNNFSITKAGTGYYRIIRNTGSFSTANNVVIVTPEASANARTVTYTIAGGNIEVYTWQSNTNAQVDNQFSFMVYEF